MRKFLQNLQPSSGGKENLVGVGRTPQDSAVVDNKPAVQLVQDVPATNETEVRATDAKNTSSMATVNPSLYQKLIVDDLTSTTGPSEKYWEVVAERRRKALEDVLEENRRLLAVVSALEQENLSCKELLENTTDLVNSLKDMINENANLSDEDKSVSDENESLSDENESLSGLSTSDSSSSVKHVHKKIKLSNPDEFSNSK